MIGTIKAVAIMGLIGAVASGISYWKGDTNGFNRCTQKVDDAKKDKTIHELKEVGRLGKVEVQHEAKVKESIRIVKQAVDPTNCTTTRAPDATLREHGWVRDDPVRR